ncbi:Rpp14/Pop5 family protein [Nanoarchaeota archaeon]
MPLLPSLKEKKRYLVFETICEKKILFKDIAAAIDDSLHHYIGLLGTSQAGMQILQEKWNQSQQKGIIRINHKYVDHLKASLALIKKIKNQQITLRSVGVSGILKKTQKYFEVKK